MTEKLRIVIADDERPARRFLASMLDSFADVEIVGEAETGLQAVELIERLTPDLALLDLQMPELDGMSVVKHLTRKAMPLIAFVTAYDQYAARAFDLNAIDYLLKPVPRDRLRETVDRARQRLAEATLIAEGLSRAGQPGEEQRVRMLERVPVRKGDEIRLIPVSQIASLVAEGELLHISTLGNEQYAIAYRLKDIEAKLDSTKFAKLGRGALINIDAVSRIVAVPGGTYIVYLDNGQELKTSRLQSRILRERLLRL